MLARSRVVHASIDPSVPITSTKKIGKADENETADTAAEDDDGDANDDGEAAAAANPDRTITNARLARAEDGQLTTHELGELYKNAGAPVKSAYNEGQRAHPPPPTFGQRAQLPIERTGFYEPEWTSYTHYWKTVLGLIFTIPCSSTH
jgi:RNA exonuclease NGL2